MRLFYQNSKEWLSEFRNEIQNLSFSDNPIRPSPHEDVNDSYKEQHLELTKFLTKVCQKEKILVPNLLIVSPEVGGCASGLRNYSAMICVPHDDLDEYTHLKCAKATILHEIGHIKNNDPIVSSIIYLSSVVIVLLSLIAGILNLFFLAPLVAVSSLFIIPWLVRRYNHYTEYRADAFVQKYGYQKIFLKQLNKLDFESPTDCFSHPHLDNRAKKLGIKL